MKIHPKAIFLLAACSLSSSHAKKQVFRLSEREEKHDRALSFGRFGQEKSQDERLTLGEDEGYWRSLVQSMSVPTIPPPPTPAPPTDAPVTPAPVAPPTDAPVTPAPVAPPTDAPVTPAPVAPPTDAPVTPAPVAPPTDAPVTPATAPPTDAPVVTATLLERLSAIALGGAADFEDTTSYQYAAYEWLNSVPDIADYDDSALTELYALRCIYESTNGDSWTSKTGWTDDQTGDFDECAWYGITCSAADVVDSIDLNDNNLIGKLTPEVALLKSLELLELSYNNFQDSTIPTEIGGISTLKILNLISANVKGDASKDLEFLISAADSGESVLEQVWLDYNYDGVDFSGSRIPTEIGLLTTLTSFSLLYNDFAGTIPTEIGLCTNMESLYLTYNALTGEIPTEVGNMASLQVLSMYYNAISGSLPTELGLCTDMRKCHFPQNLLSLFFYCD